MTKKLMKLCLSLFAVVMMTESASATVFYIDRLVADGSVSGTVTTDGTLGVLSTANITDWDLVISDGGWTFNLLGDGSVGDNSDVLIEGSALSATATELWFDFAAYGYALFQNPTLGSGTNWWCMEGPNSHCTIYGQGMSVHVKYPKWYRYLTAAEVVGVALQVEEVSEPGMLGLLVIGLGGLLAVRRRKA